MNKKRKTDTMEFGLLELPAALAARDGKRRADTMEFGLLATPQSISGPAPRDAYGWLETVVTDEGNARWRRALGRPLEALSLALHRAAHRLNPRSLNPRSLNPRSLNPIVWQRRGG